MARRHPWFISLTVMAAATIVGAQTAVPQTAVPPAAPATMPATQPTTRQATYDRLLGGDPARADRPLLPVGKPTVDLTTGASSVAPGAPALQMRREGTYIQQVGRLAKSADGVGWEFVFSSDGAAMVDPPVKVLPNLKLMAMEDALESGTHDLLFRVTGMVTEYRGRNYVLFEKVVVVQDNK